MTIANYSETSRKLRWVRFKALVRDLRTACTKTIIELGAELKKVKTSQLDDIQVLN